MLTEITVNSTFLNMKRLGLIGLGLISTLSLYSQKEIVMIEKNINEYFVDTLYTQIDFQYSNIFESAVVLWIEKENLDSLSDSKLIRKHFFTRKGDWSLMQIIWDGNVESFIPGLFDSFIKILKPNDEFTVSFLLKGGYRNNPDLFNSLEKHIVVVKAFDIKGFQVDSSIDMFNYKANSIIIFADWLN